MSLNVPMINARQISDMRRSSVSMKIMKWNVGCAISQCVRFIQALASNLRVQGSIQQINKLSTPVDN
jgi:hypothetical protein